MTTLWFHASHIHFSSFWRRSPLLHLMLVRIWSKISWGLASCMWSLNSSFTWERANQMNSMLTNIEDSVTLSKSWVVFEYLVTEANSLYLSDGSAKLKQNTMVIILDKRESASKQTVQLTVGWRTPSVSARNWKPWNVRPDWLPQLWRWSTSQRETGSLPDGRFWTAAVSNVSARCCSPWPLASSSCRWWPVGWWFSTRVSIATDRRFLWPCTRLFPTAPARPCNNQIQFQSPICSEKRVSPTWRNWSSPPGTVSNGSTRTTERVEWNPVKFNRYIYSNARCHWFWKWWVLSRCCCWRIFPEKTWLRCIRGGTLRCW